MLAARVIRHFLHGKHYIVRLQVAVTDVVPMHVLRGLKELAHNAAH